MAHAWESVVSTTHSVGWCMSHITSYPYPRVIRTPDLTAQVVQYRGTTVRPDGREALVRHLRTMTTFCGKCCWHSRTASNGTGVV